LSSSAIERRLEELGLMLPEAAAPVANYVPHTVAGNLLFISGQVPFRDGTIAVTGKLGAGVSVERGREAARQCALNVLAQARAACGGDLGRLKRCLKLGGFVACAPGFTDHPKVINGASDLMVEVMGDAGRHARFAVGSSSLPLDAAVEVEAVFEIG
jgi:enamine deaminase RidA (YjgF/YER057c/UK114 family)